MPERIFNCWCVERVAYLRWWIDFVLSVYFSDYSMQMFLAFFEQTKNCMRRCLKRLLVPNSKEEYIWTSPIIKCLCSKTNYCTALRSINYIEVISMSSSFSWSSSSIKILSICCHFVLLLWCKWISLGGIHVLELLF